MREDWIECKATLVGELIRGINYKKPQSSDEELEGYLPILRANNISDNQLNFENLKYVEEGLINNDQKILLGDIIFAMSSGSKHLVGKSAQAKNNYNGSFGAFCSAYRPKKNINSKFIQFYFHSTKFRRILSKASKGSNINNLKREHLLNALIPLPPLPEQRAIVAKIEQLFSELDHGIENLKTAQEQLKVYRQAVLKKAFEGGFSDKSYDLRKINSICEVVRGGSPRPAGSIKFYDGPIPFMKVKDISRNKGVYVDKAEYSIKEAGLKKTRQVSACTLLLTNSGATLGVPAITKIETTFNDGIAAFLGLEKDDLLYHYYYWESKTKYLRNINQGAAQPNLNTSVIGQMEIPIYEDKSEHNRIVQQIESRLSVCDKVEETIAENLQKAEALRQSILKKAFAGELLTEAEITACKKEKDWEPAGELLKRIRKEKTI